MQTATHAVGIDLGTTFSCIAYLNEHGEPITLANQEGELATPSVVMFDGEEPVVGTEALRNSIVRPDEVVQNSKRYIGLPQHYWNINGKKYTPVDIATLILKKLISAAQEKIGPIEQAVITVPAQFSDAQRHATMQAGLNAGLQRVDIINEPVAAALCYVLGTEGLWFTKLANEQKILVYDLGGGTFDLSLVRYRQTEVSVIKSSGDLHLGGVDWTRILANAIADQFTKEFNADPRQDPESLQFLVLEAEQAKRSLTVRPKAALTCQHSHHRKTYQVLQEQFLKLAKPLLDKTVRITQDMLRDEKGKVRWGQVNVVLTTGGSSRMPMIRDKLKEISGTTINTSLSPDQSISHGATYYAGMLLTDSKFAKSILNEKATAKLGAIKQRSVNARSLGVMVRDPATGKKFPHYLIPANTPLPTNVTHKYGTVQKNQQKVRLEIVESGTSQTSPLAILGDCVIEQLPPNLPEGSEIAVKIKYDEQARVHVSAKDMTSGKIATAEIIRQENLVHQLESMENERDEGIDLAMLDPSFHQGDPSPQKQSKGKQKRRTAKTSQKPATSTSSETSSSSRKSKGQEKSRSMPTPKPRSIPAAKTLEESSKPVPLCNRCGEPLNDRKVCPKCGPKPTRKKSSRSQQSSSAKRASSSKPTQTSKRKTSSQSPSANNSDLTGLPPIDDDQFLDLGGNG